MLAKEASMSRHEAWSDWKARSGMFFPYLPTLIPEFWCNAFQVSLTMTCRIRLDFFELDLALSRDNDTIDSSKMGFSLLKKCVFSLEGSPTHLEPMNEAASWGVVWLRSADKTRVWWKSETGETSNDPILPNTQKRRGFGRFQWWSMMTINGLLIWRFPEIGVPPNHPFIDGFSLVNHYKPSSYWGIFHLWKPPYCWKVPSQSSQFSRWGARQQRGGGGRWSQGAKLAVLEGFRSVCLGGLIIDTVIYNI